MFVPARADLSCVRPRNANKVEWIRQTFFPSFEDGGKGTKATKVDDHLPSFYTDPHVRTSRRGAPYLAGIPSLRLLQSKLLECVDHACHHLDWRFYVHIIYLMVACLPRPAGYTILYTDQEIPMLQRRTR